MEEITYPIRINRYLFLKGYCSRRKADTLISEGKVHINNKVAVLGSQVQKTDKVSLAPDVRALPKGYSYYLYHKPRGVVSHNPQKGEKSVEDVAGIKKKVSPVGRLDKDSRGLMLLTDDGRIVNTLLNPDFAHTREYRVTADKRMKDGDLKRLARGVSIEGYKTRAATVSRVNDSTVDMTLIEGKKHQIRRMFAALGYQVTDLMRTRISNFSVKGLEEGSHRELSEKERAKFLKELDIPTPN